MRRAVSVGDITRLNRMRCNVGCDLTCMITGSDVAITLSGPKGNENVGPCLIEQFVNSFIPTGKMGITN